MLETTSATDKDTTAIGPNVMSLEVPRNYEEGEVRTETGAREHGTYGVDGSSDERAVKSVLRRQTGQLQPTQ